MISGSSLQRAATCPASEAFPHRNTISKDSERGTTVHKYLADVSTMGRDEALVRVPDEYRMLCELIDLEKLPASKPHTFAPEIAFVWNVKTSTVRELGQSLGRNYGKLAASEIPCTLDNVGIANDGVTAIVTDYKGGWSNATAAFENMQLRFGALCFCRANKLAKAHISIIRVKEDGSSWYDSAELGEWDLNVIEGELIKIVDDVLAAKLLVDSGGVAQPTMGEHCRYCPAFHSCPANNSLAVALGSGELGFEINDENAAAAWVKIKAAEKILKEAKAAVKTLAAINPIDIGNGKHLGEKVTKRERISGGVAFRVLRDAYGDDVADAACEVKSSKASIERAIKPSIVESDGKLAPAMRAVIEGIRQRGGIRTTKKMSVVEHKAQLTNN